MPRADRQTGTGAPSAVKLLYPILIFIPIYILIHLLATSHLTDLAKASSASYQNSFNAPLNERMLAKDKDVTRTNREFEAKNYEGSHDQVALANKVFHVISTTTTTTTSSTATISIHLGKNKLTIQQSTLEHVQGLPEFPKIIHIIWNDKAILNTTFQMIEHGAKNLQRLNPDWKVVVHNFEDIDRTIREFNDHPDILDNAMQADLLNAHLVEKTDAFRLMMLYQTGGLYTDIDRVMNVKLNDVINVKTAKMVLPTYYNVNFANDLFGTSPGNDIILNILRRECEKRKTLSEKNGRRNGWLKSSDQMEIGNTHSASLEMDLFGRRLDFGDKESVWNEARDVLTSHTGGSFVTKKDEWCNGLLVNDYEGCKAVSRDPLYKAYNVTKWVKQVDEAWQ